MIFERGKTYRRQSGGGLTEIRVKRAYDDAFIARVLVNTVDPHLRPPDEDVAFPVSDGWEVFTKLTMKDLKD